MHLTKAGRAGRQDAVAARLTPAVPVRTIESGCLARNTELLATIEKRIV